VRPTDRIDEGPREDVPIVCLHGFLGCAEDWRGLIDALSPVRRCVAFDLPGHGARPEPIQPGPTSFVEAVAGIADRLEAAGVDRFDVLGYSMGGRLALGLVAEAPERVRRAVVVGGSPGIDDEIARRTRKREDDFRAREMGRGPFEDWLDAWYAQPLFDGVRAAPAYPAMRARRLTGRPDALAQALRALGPGVQPPLAHRLKQTTVPLLLVAGALDRKYVALNRGLAAAGATIRDLVVPGAGHAPHLETPDAFLTAVREFLVAPGA
jgi:2-succinyl-6-hydroxy-2,4-cyclohexadiene-1-carboxylate synthase